MIDTSKFKKFGKYDIKVEDIKGVVWNPAKDEQSAHAIVVMSGVNIILIAKGYELFKEWWEGKFGETSTKEKGTPEKKS